MLKKDLEYRVHELETCLHNLLETINVFDRCDCDKTSDDSHWNDVLGAAGLAKMVMGGEE